MGGDRLPFLPLLLPWAAAQKLAVHCICQRRSPAKKHFESIEQKPCIRDYYEWGGVFGDEQMMCDG